ncbi:MAG: hypothetical protein LBR12_03355 [Opitutaceae bacterium]|jgi:glycerol-3-phosphate dehydrogenase (NAD(P)+)|nr:hypothetical protein [Opitutaceae bacterium]
MPLEPARRTPEPFAPMNPSVITIIGSGMMGSALAFPARENGHSVRLVGTPLDRDIIAACRQSNRHPKFDRDFPEGVRFFQWEEAQTALDGADLVIGGVSSFGVDWFADAVLPLVPETTPILSVTKGLIADASGNLLNYPEYWKRKIAPAKRSLNAVGGPCTSYELVAHDPTVVSFCGDDPAVLDRIRSLLQTGYYHIETTTDVAGVECAVALKNAYALTVAFAVGLNEKLNNGRERIIAAMRSYAANGVTPEFRAAFGPQHYNSQAAVFGQSAREMRRLLQFIVGNDNQLHVGIGDLYVTVFGGRTQLLGCLLGLGLTYDEALKILSGVTLESTVIVTRIVTALRSWAAAGKLDLADFPLIAAFGDILIDGKTTQIPWSQFVR